MSRRRHRTYRLPEDQLQHVSGMRATGDGVCQRCDEPVLKDQRIIPYRGGYIHVGCASGADDG